jgi:phenylalanyl-tRNA synthetase beta chain
MNNGFKPINSVVDKLNYITLLTNVPSGAYDADKITDKTISISLAKSQEKYLGFGNKEYSLDANDIVVRNNNEIICLAGILGCTKFGITNETKNIFIEFGNFNYKNIRNTNTKFDIFTDAAKRFSKKINIFSTLLSCQMIKDQFKGCDVKFPCIYGIKVEERKVNMDFNLMKTIIGFDLDKNEVIDNLS